MGELSYAGEEDRWRKGHQVKLGDIFREGSEARRRFAKFYAALAIVIILTALILLALATRG